VFESLWDAIKLALLGVAHSYSELYVATGASLYDWNASESAELSRPGAVDALQLWAPARPSARTSSSAPTATDRFARTERLRSAPWGLGRRPTASSYARSA
jgi:hypothetical protein